MPLKNHWKAVVKGVNEVFSFVQVCCVSFQVSCVLFYRLENG